MRVLCIQSGKDLVLKMCTVKEGEAYIVLGECHPPHATTHHYHLQGYPSIAFFDAKLVIPCSEEEDTMSIEEMQKINVKELV